MLLSAPRSKGDLRTLFCFSLLWQRPVGAGAESKLGKSAKRPVTCRSSSDQTLMTGFLPRLGISHPVLESLMSCRVPGRW